MCLQLLLVELDPDAWPVRRDQVALIPVEGLHDELVEEVTALVDALLDQEIRRAHVHLDRSRGQNRPTPHVGRHVHVKGFSHAGDLAELFVRPLRRRGLLGSHPNRVEAAE